MINISSPFWIDQKSNINYIAYLQTKGECCFNYITRFPKKDYYKEKPNTCILEVLVPYEDLFS